MTHPDKSHKSGSCRSRKVVAVLEAAEREFLEHGYAEASMDRIAVLAGVSKATVYAYFKGKADLFSKAIRLRIEQQQVFTLPLTFTDAKSTLTELGLRLLTILMSREAIAGYRVVLTESARHPELAEAFYTSGPGEGFSKVTHVMAELSRRSMIHAPNPELAADQFMGMLRSQFFSRTLLGLPFSEGQSLEDIVAASVDLLLRAFTSSPHETQIGQPPVTAADNGHHGETPISDL